ncbi:MAG TPA: hypothetical protein VG759_03615 [Candidatus Angelobacter sp.]|jgi:hypothetical protein|nr:hypothetical protein [Candidatus Angelobacter sp.]
MKKFMIHSIVTISLLVAGSNITVGGGGPGPAPPFCPPGLTCN